MQTIEQDGQGGGRRGQATQQTDAQTTVLVAEMDGPAPSKRESERGLTWRTVLGRPLGKAILALCPNGRKECTNSRCVLQPLCMCARADLHGARKAEATIWLAVAICGGVLILVAFLRALLLQRG